MSDTDPNNNDLFTSLGGSLMKDLLADLVVDEDDGDWLNLEQLEQELRRLDGSASNLGMVGSTDASHFAAPTSAAGWLIQSNNTHPNGLMTPAGISHSGGVATVGLGELLTPSTVTQQSYPDSTTKSSMDAWSLSLQKFAASSLQEDFLIADSQRKKNSQQEQQPLSFLPSQTLPHGSNNSNVQSFDFSTAEDYDLSEKPLAPLPLPPPGLSIQQHPQPPTLLTSVVPDKEEKQPSIVDGVVPMAPEIKLPNPPIISYAAAVGSTGSVPKPVPMTPHNSIAVPNTNDGTIDAAGIGSSSVYPSFLPAPTPLPPNLEQHHNQQLPQQMLQPPPVTVMLGIAATPQPLQHIPVAVPVGVPAWQQQQHPPVQTMLMPDNLQPIHPVHLMHQNQSPAPQLQRPVHHPSAHGGPQILFCNPHYDAPSISASMILSKYMRQKDITYVVHAILKAILMNNQQQDLNDRYDVQYYHRHILMGGGNLSARSTKTQLTGLTNKKKQTEASTKGKENSNDNGLVVQKSELESRHQKAKEWSQSHSVLGSTMKSDSTRPRALIAISPTDPTLSSLSNEKENNKNIENERQSRAALWKSRIYIDQAYQALSGLLDAWRNQQQQEQHNQQQPGIGSNGAGGNSSTIMATAVQPHFLKLLKCLGISGSTVATSDNTTASKYNADPNVLQLVLKLPKGKNMLARLLEQALLPPTVVDLLLPMAIKIIFQSTSSSSSALSATTSPDQLYSEDRLLNAMTGVIQTLPTLSPMTILECCNAILSAIVSQKPTTITSTNTATADVLSSTARMQCTHALLHRGSIVASNNNAAAVDATSDSNSNASTSDSNDSIMNQWKVTEQKFFQILSAM